MYFVKTERSSLAHIFLFKLQLKTVTNNIHCASVILCVIGGGGGGTSEINISEPSANDENRLMKSSEV